MPNKDIDMAVTIFDNSGTNERTNERNYYADEPIMIEMTSTKNTIITNGISATLTARMGTGGNQVNVVLVRR